MRRHCEANSVTGCAASASIERLTRIVEHAVSTTCCYDTRGNVIQKTQATAGATDTTSYTYTAANQLSGVTTPDGAPIGYAFDTDSRISGVQVAPNGASAASTVVSSVTYLPFGPISSYTLGNGQAGTHAYDANYRVTDIASPAFTLHLARDLMGNVSAIGAASGANPATETTLLENQSIWREGMESLGLEWELEYESPVAPWKSAASGATC